jgi:hypothetical protein
MSELLNERQSQIKKLLNGQYRIERYEFNRNDFAGTDVKKIEPKPVPREVILRLIKFFEQK